MLKRLSAALCIGFCILLLLSASDAIRAAQEALALWQNRVLPTLFPFYVLVSLLFRFGVLERMQAIVKRPAWICLLLGALGGYPTGARLCGIMDCADMAGFCNLCSPMFLMGVVCIGLFQTPAGFLPLAIAHYGSACVGLMIQGLCRSKSASAAAPAKPCAAPAGNAMTDIGEGMLAMLRIGGCIVFFYVLSKLATALLFPKQPLLTAIVTGLAELTTGCAAVPSLRLSVRAAYALTAFFVSFGGACICAQAMIVTDLPDVGKYLCQKLLLGLASMVIAYLLTPLFVSEAAPAWADRAERYLSNGLFGLALTWSCVLGLVAVYLLSLVMKKPGCAARAESKPNQ